MPFLPPIQTSHYWLRNTQIPPSLLDLPDSHPLRSPAASTDFVSVDLEIREGVIQQLCPSTSLQTVGQEPSTATQATVSEVLSIDCCNRVILPCFVELHTHLDKGHSWPRSPNPNGTFDAALAMATEDKKYWNAEDLYRRMDFGLRCSYVHGTRAIRTHLDVPDGGIQKSLEVFLALQQEWRDRITLQAVCLTPLDYFLTPEGELLIDQMAEVGGVIGGLPLMEPQLDYHLDHVFTLAKERQLALDFHTDESNNPNDMNLRAVAIAAQRNDFTGQIVCGHCCSLAVQSPDVVAKTLKEVQAVNLGIVSLPLCNLYLQDRAADYTPRWRGITLLHELKREGIPVAIASDNCRDAFFAFGDHDGLEVFTQSVRIGHLDHPYSNWINTITRTPADLMGLPHLGRISPSQSADFILFNARNFSELLSRPQSDRMVIRNGSWIDTTLPDYAELDDLVVSSQ